MSLRTALETAQKLKEKNNLLEVENKALKAQFARWAHNAQNAGLYVILDLHTAPGSQNGFDCYAFYAKCYRVSRSMVFRQF